MSASLPEESDQNDDVPQRQGVVVLAANSAQRGHYKRIREFLLIFLPVAALVAMGAWLLGEARIDAELSLLMASEKSYVELSSVRLSEELDTPVRQLASLVSEAPVREVYQAAYGTDLHPMEQAFLSLLARNPEYDQVRWIDEHGRERVRVNNREGGPQLVETSQLQDKHDRYYFTEAMHLEGGKIYISPLDLNIEHGQIDQPYTPTIRIATRVFDAKGQPRGILIVNVAARAMLDAFVANAGPAASRLLLVDTDGYLLKDIGANTDWGSMLRREVPAAARHAEAWRHISPQKNGQITLADGVWTWRSIAPASDANAALAHRIDWKVITHLPASTLSALDKEVWPAKIANSLLILGLIGFGIGRYVTTRAARARAETETDIARSQAKAAQRLQEAQASFQLLFEANTNGLIVIDDQGLIAMVNPAAARMFGYQPRELWWQPVETLIPEGHRGHHAEHRASYQLRPTARGMGAGLDLYGLRKDGSVFPVEVGLSPYQHAGRGFVLATIVDIAYRKHTQDEIVQLNEQLEQRLAELRQREKERDLWSRIIYSSLNEIYLFDAVNWHFVFVNQGALANLGYSMEELRGMTPMDLKPLFGIADFKQLVAPLLNHTKPTIRFETVHRRKDSSLYPVEVHLQLASQQDTDYFLAVIQDITERQRTESSLQTIIDSTAAMIWNTDASGKITFASARLTDLLGYDPKDFVGRSLKEVFASEIFYSIEGKMLTDSFIKLVTNGTPVYRLDHRALDAKGNRRWLSTSMTPVYDVSHQLIQVVGMSQDIDTQKKAEIALSDINQTLEARVREEVEKNQAQERTLQEKSKLASMGEMIGNIAHQWRQPINTLNILLMDLEDAYDHGEVDKKYLHDAVESCNTLVQRMSRTIDDFMNFFRRDKQAANFSLTESLNDCVGLVKDSFQHHRIELALHCQNGVVLSGIAGEFSHAILNLLVNAKESILANNAANGKVSIDVHENENSVEIMITDNGGGIPETIRPKIFDAYFTTKAQGTGIGLYMTRMIIENTMHGSLSVENTQGGARFILRIPKAPYEPEQHKEPA